MKHEPIGRPAPDGRESLLSDFRLIGEAIVDAFRGLSSSLKLDSRSSKLLCCGGGC